MPRQRAQPGGGVEVGVRRVEAVGRRVVDVDQDRVESRGVVRALAAREVEATCAARMEAFNEVAERIYINWLQATSRAG